MALKIDPSLNPLAARERANAPSATDFRQFAALRRGAQANDPHTLREVARQFESIFTKMMLDSMRKASFGDAMFGSDQVDMYQGMMDDQLAMQLSQGRGIGLAEMLIRQLSQGGQETGAGAVVPGRDEAGAAGSARPEQKRRFIEELLPQAQAAARELGVDARAIVAQAALETGWGTSLPADAGASSHNYFGIKAGAGWRGASVGSATTEFTAGVAGTEQARFRAYGSLAENVADYVRVLRAPRYAEALGTGSDVHAFATALQRGGYATDPEYASKLESVFRQIAAADVNPFKSADGAPIPAQELTNA
ncbi:MAG TPA: glucosaminidase domain-containing protein [Steroidobacteraceae bacterium]|nr:glucosaminidase domain-containing protein [Steroidobacteraceae bacterium]